MYYSELVVLNYKFFEVQYWCTPCAYIGKSKLHLNPITMATYWFMYLTKWKKHEKSVLLQYDECAFSFLESIKNTFIVNRYIIYSAIVNVLRRWLLYMYGIYNIRVFFQFSIVVTVNRTIINEIHKCLKLQDDTKKENEKTFNLYTCIWFRSKTRPDGKILRYLY